MQRASYLPFLYLTFPTHTYMHTHPHTHQHMYTVHATTSHNVWPVLYTSHCTCTHTKSALHTHTLAWYLNAATLPRGQTRGMVAQSPALWNEGVLWVLQSHSLCRPPSFACTLPSFLNGLLPLNRTFSSITKLSPPERASKKPTQPSINML